jgi:hypothetical protein
LSVAEEGEAMSRCLSGACAGALLLAAVGCLSDSFLMPQFVVAGPKTVVSSSVFDVSSKLNAGLSDAGIMVQMNRVGSDLRMVGASKNGTVFCLHVSPAPKSGGKKTLVRMQWDRGGDDELWRLVEKILTSPEATAAED